MRYLLCLIALVPVAVEYADSSAEFAAHYTGSGNHAPLDKATLSAKVNPVEESCLATMVYGEARGESDKGMVAVAYSAVNRANKKTLCQVVLARKQYSIFNNNPALRAAALNPNLEPRQKNKIDQESWARAQNVARLVMTRSVPDPTGGATHYIADKVMKAKGYTYPRWAKQYTQVAEIGGHRFFKPYYPNRNKNG